MSRVAVYVDFDNIVRSRYDHLHGSGSFHKDKAAAGEGTPRLEQARVDLGAVLDYASSYGTVALARAYADWSQPVNAAYRSQLVERSLELVQLFPAAAYGKNGGDIRLAIDAVEDMFRLPDVTHVVIVAGDSDYVPLAQRLKRLNRQVVAVGVTGSTARSLVSAVDRFASYEELPGVDEVVDDEPEPEPQPVKKAAARKSAGGKLSHEEQQQRRATNTLRRALRLGETDDDGWQHGSAVKNQMTRIDPEFSEKSLGFSSFTQFLESRSDLVVVDKDSRGHRARLI